jgi:hypothetical protein
VVVTLGQVALVEPCHSVNAHGNMISVNVKRLASLALTLTGFLASCGTVDTADGSGLFFPTDPEEQTFVMQALYEGPLTVREGCVLIGRPGDFSIAVWPKGFTTQRDDSERIVVLDERGKVVAIEGQVFDMSGGLVAEFRPEGKVEPREQQLRRVEDWLGNPIPQRCLGSDVDGVFSVGETHALV